MINAFALSVRTIDNTTTPKVSLRLPWAMRLLDFQPTLNKTRNTSFLQNPTDFYNLYGKHT